MSYQNELTKQQERNFKRRCRFTACGEPCDVFTHREHRQDMQLVTINRNAETGAAWLELTEYIRVGDGYYIDPAMEIHLGYVNSLDKDDEDTARRIIVQELRRWASMPEGTIAGYTPEQIAAEADRISKQQ